ncbi:copper chaperone PCu(A)C [Comamonas composti]|uniref:copper chaperone PCu(A)C n=1 Tax=Comamonas composti TaxID=408558 RepID=UPI0004264D7A|nr:copper chaperone PCu(A)C [Comamonas composti]
MTLRQWTSSFLIAASMGLSLAQAHAGPAHVKAENGWVRASVPGQQATGAFVRLTAEESLRLVGVESPVAGVAEVHEMKMEGDVMRMRAIEGLDLPKGQAVELKPGGYHLMLQQLKSPVLKDSKVPLTLVFKDAKGETSRLSLELPARAMAPAGGHGGHAGHSH